MTVIRKWFVTGGAGFIGSHLVDALTNRGEDVVVFDDLSTGSLDNLKGSPARLIEADLRDAFEVSKAMSGCTHVVHLGALGSVQRSIVVPLSTNAVNVNGTLNVLMGAREAGIERVVYASSSSIYGNTPVLPKHEGMPFAPCRPTPFPKWLPKSTAEFLAICTACLSLRFGSSTCSVQDNDHRASTPQSFLDGSIRSLRVTRRSFLATENKLAISRSSPTTSRQ
jgi:nucleoside-diphosphate-sugar epimerase